MKLFKVVFLLIPLWATACSSWNKTSSLKISTLSEPRFTRLWSRQTVKPEYMGYLQPAAVSPLITSKWVFAGNGVDSAIAYNRKSGSLGWRLSLKKGIEGIAYDPHSEALFFGSNNGQFYHVSAETGLTQWTFPLNSESTASPLVQGGFVFHMAMNGSLYAFEKDSGRVMWVKSRQPKDSLVIRGTTPPVFHDGRVYVGYSDGYLIAYSAADGQPLWEKRISDGHKFNDINARPLVAGSCLLAANFSESLYCLNPSTGEVRWQMSEGGSAQDITAVGQEVIYASHEAIFVLDLGSGQIRKKHVIDSKWGIPTSAVPYKSWLVFGLSEGPLVLMEKDTGRWVDTFYPGRGITAPPTVQNDTGEIFVLSRQANVYKLAIEQVERKKEFLWAKPSVP